MFYVLAAKYGWHYRELVGGRFVLVWSYTIREAWKLISSLIDMANQGAPQTAKESNLKRFRNRLKKLFGRESQPESTPPTRSNSPPADLG